MLNRHPLFCLVAPQQTYQWISVHQRAQLECLANNWQKAYKIGATGQIYFLFQALCSKGTADSSGHFSVCRKQTEFEYD